jgi:bis(5'-nucleosidyl)-tetraphosphatase
VQYHVSIGVIIYRMYKTECQYLLLKYSSGHWDFSKGAPELMEERLETAERELKEETGLGVTFIDGFETSFRYVFRLGKDIVRKKVVFLLGEAIGDTVTLSKEHQDYVWLPFEQAKERLTYENAQEALTQANMSLNNV